MRINVRTRGALAFAFGLAACDSGAEVAVVDWSKLEARVTQLENAERVAAGAARQGRDRRRARRRDGAVRACVQPADIASFITLDDVPPVDLTGYATVASVTAVEGAVTALDTRVEAVEGQLPTFLTEVDIKDFQTEAQVDQKLTQYDTITVADGKYLQQIALDAYAKVTVTNALRAQLEAYIATTDAALGTYLKTDTAASTYLTKTSATQLYQPKGDYLTDADLPDPVDLSGYALKTDLADLREERRPHEVRAPQRAAEPDAVRSEDRPQRVREALLYPRHHPVRDVRARSTSRTSASTR